VESSCEHGEAPLCSIKCGELLDQLSIHLASQGLCSMELVSYFCCLFTEVDRVVSFSLRTL
jgi:hypothetical protein